VLYTAVMLFNLATCIMPLASGTWPTPPQPLFVWRGISWYGSDLEQESYVQLIVASLPAVSCIWRDALRGRPREHLAFIKANYPRRLGGTSMRITNSMRTRLINQISAGNLAAV
jgi:hypothetical protein